MAEAEKEEGENKPEAFQHFWFSPRRVATNAPRRRDAVIYASRSSPNLREIFDDIGALMEADDYDDDEYLKPTDSAADRMRRLLEEAAGEVRADFPLGTVHADGRGGLRLEWMRKQRNVRLIIPANPDRSAYIYHEAGDEYGSDYDVTPPNLAHRLNWLNERNGNAGRRS